MLFLMENSFSVFVYFYVNTYIFVYLVFVFFLKSESANSSYLLILPVHQLSNHQFQSQPQFQLQNYVV